MSWKLALASHLAESLEDKCLCLLSSQRYEQTHVGVKDDFSKKLCLRGRLISYLLTCLLDSLHCSSFYFQAGSSSEKKQKNHNSELQAPSSG